MKYFKIIAIYISITFLTNCTVMDKTMENLGAINVATLSEELNPKYSTIELPHFAQSDCPRIEIMNELGMLHEFAYADIQTKADLISSATIASIISQCSYDPKRLIISAEISFSGELGSKSIEYENETLLSYPFFVAIVSPDNKILTKETFTATLTYQKDSRYAHNYKKIQQTIPVISAEHGKFYKIMIGFQLTKDQLKYNRLTTAKISNYSQAILK